MTKGEFFAELEALLELQAGSLKGDEQLSSFETWDSMQMLGFIAIMNAKLGIVADGESVAKAISVSDLLAIVGERIVP